MEVIKFLPSSSIKLETELTSFGELLVQTSKELEFDKKVLGMHETRIVDAFIIEFLTDIKFEFKALLALSDLHDRHLILEDADNLPDELVFHTYQQARELGHKISGVSVALLLKLHGQRLKVAAKTPLYELRTRLKKRRIPRQQLPTRNVDFLLSGYYLNNIHVLLPLVEELQKLGKSMAYLATRVETYLDLQKRGTPNLLYMGNQGTTSVRIDQEELQKFIDHFFSRFPEKWKASAYFKKQFREKLVRRIEQSAGWYTGFKEVFEKLKPGALVLNTGSAPDSRMLIQMARNRGILDFVIVHGLFHDTPLLNFQNMTYKFVWSKYQASLINKYNPAIKCIVSGSPKHDALLKKFQQSATPSPYNKPFILFPTTPPNNVIIDQQTYNMILTHFVHAAKAMPEMMFVVKLHPTEKIESVRSVVEKLHARVDNLVITKTEDTYNLLHHCRAVFVVASTVGFEALLFQKRVIAYNFNPNEKWYPFMPSPKFKFIDNFENFISDIRAVLNAPEIDNGDERDYYFTSGAGLKIIEEYLMHDHVSDV